MSFTYESIYFDDPIEPGRVLDIFLPKNITEDIAILFVHGGGWQQGTRAIFHKIMREFNSKGLICASTDYRLGDGINIWDQLTDLRHAYDIFADKLKKMNCPVNIVVHGSSAGAHLAALIGMTKPGQCGESIEYNNRTLSHLWIKPAGITLQSAPVLFEPWDNIFPESWNAIKKIVGVSYSEKPELYQKLAPMNYIDSQTCPVFHLCAENEHMFPIRYILRFKEKMDKLGRFCKYKIYSDAEHGFFYDLSRQQQREAFNDILTWIERL